MENNDDLYELKRQEMPEMQDPEPQKQHVEQPRWKSWAVWVSFFGALWVIAEAFGLPERWGIQESTFRTVLDAVGSILIGFGVLNNPTDRNNF